MSGGPGRGSAELAVGEDAAEGRMRRCIPGPVSGLYGAGILGWTVPIGAACFSVVTMTTLGFGDMHAAPTSPTGHALLTLQVLLGYVLLGALVTRFAIMFKES